MIKNLNWVISQLRFFGKSLLKLTRNSNDGVEVVIGGKPFVIAFLDIK